MITQFLKDVFAAERVRMNSGEESTQAGVKNMSIKKKEKHNIHTKNLNKVTLKKYLYLLAESVQMHK